VHGRAEDGRQHWSCDAHPHCSGLETEARNATLRASAARRVPDATALSVSGAPGILTGVKRSDGLTEMLVLVWTRQIAYHKDNV
jgi:hypothetical protein